MELEQEEVLDGEGPAAPRTAVRAKRPRFIATGDSFGVMSTPKRLKRPADQVAELVPNPTSKKSCAFCRLPGDIRECEGKLMGPFRMTRRDGTPGKKFYAHRNCALWAPETYVGKGGRLQDVHQALARSKRKKCSLCGDTGASLACMFKNTACCRPMHFRCALQGGGSLRVGYNTFCRKHSKCSRGGRGAPPPFEDYIDNTPVPKQFLLPGRGCDLCDGDTYDADRGAVLTCSFCYKRQHSKCVFPLLGRDVTFAARSWQGKYQCKSCMKCFKCEEAVDLDVYTMQDSVYPNEDDDEPQCNTIKCISCKHSAIHVACLPPESKRDHWRCDMCRICRHCNVINISREQWNERFEACPECAAEIRKGGVVCPVCVKVYREGENLPMVQCDYCDKWIHADVCGGISTDKFREMGQSDVKYRCPICTEEKKKRDVERRRSKEGANEGKYDGYGERYGARRTDLEAIMKQVPAEEDGVTFFSVRRAATQRSSLEQVCEDLSLSTEICRYCCSSGREQEMLFCADCGECYHEFCHAAKSESPIPGHEKKRQRTSRNMKTSESRQLGLGRSVEPWRCFECDSFSEISGSKVANDVLKPGHSNGLLHSADMEQFNIRESAELVKGYSVDAYDGIKLNGHHVVYVANGKHRSSGEEPLYESTSWEDKRVCELCGKREMHGAVEGRLIPWSSSTIADVSSTWLHIACAMWSNGISIHGSSGHSDTLLGARRFLLAQARRKLCVCCHKPGASLCCSFPTCENIYHFACAREVDVGCIVNTPSEKVNRCLRFASFIHVNKPFELAQLHSLRILCPQHKKMDREAEGRTPCMTEIQKHLNLNRVIKLFDRQGFSPDVEPPRKKRLSPDRLLSIRIGSLSVLHFGQLVPEVNDFIVKGCLIPLGYCAARRYWSVSYPYDRCIYFMEVCGHTQSGPIFVIRCSDAPAWKVEAKDPDEAWDVVTATIRRARIQAGMTAPSILSTHTTGLEAFGLSNSIPVVTHIESLPMAAMFNGRYSHKRVVTHRNNDIIFYNTLAKKYKPVSTRVNETGCARSEGYLSQSRIQKRHRSSEQPLVEYENARTGSAFQLEVAREILARHEGSGSASEQNRSTKELQIRAKLTPFAQALNWSRNARTKAAPNQSVVAEHMGIAASSKARTVVLRSDIDGLGVFATKDIPAGEMIIEYVGEMIRPSVSDLREKKYCAKGIGCYMFEIVPGQIVDATMCGNAARYINHSCAPNCYSKTVALENNRHVVVIFAKRRIQRGEELSYDYKFPLDDSDRVKCQCGAAQCKGFMN